MSDTHVGRKLVRSRFWRSFVRSPPWRWLVATRGWRVALNVRESLRGSDLLRENRRLTDGSGPRALEAEQARYVIDAFVARVFGDDALPPPDLRLRVGSTDRVYEYLAKGVRSSGIVLDTFGTEPDAPILDWGCGSGRTRLWLQQHPAWREHYHGCDVDADAIAWLRAHGAKRVAVCDVSPPLPFADGTFAGLFAFSVLTHIPATDHCAWYDEFHRVVVPGGRIVFTTYGAAQAARSPDRVRGSFERHHHAWQRCETPGHHYKDKCIVSADFIRRGLEGRFEVEQFVEEGYAHWNARGQDITVARRLPG